MMKSGIRAFISIFVLVFAASSLTGCASFGRKLKAFLGGQQTPPPVARTAPTGDRGPVRFSERPDLGYNSARQYRRTTKGSFEAQADVGASSGSLWVNEGQGAYLFTQNQVRREGDLLNVRISGAAKEQLDTKVNVIRRLLKKLELEKLSRLELAQRRQEEKMEKELSKSQKGADKQNPGNRAPAAAAPAAPKPEEKDEDDVNIKMVPTRIVEKLPDGNYRVKGSQAFMIDKKEYKVIVTGIVRNEDFNEDGIDSGKILDPRYDIVSNRRSLTE